MTRSSAGVIAAACALGGCAPETAEQCWTLEAVRQYGYLDAPGSSNSATSLATAGVLGNIRGAVRGARGELYVLDRLAHQVVVFDTSGTVSRVVRGGAGEGPGEFRFPMHIAPTDKGISVVDYDLRRLTEFDWQGSLLRTVRLQTPAPWKHVVRGDTAWIGYATPDSSDRPLFHRIDLATSEVTTGPLPDAQDLPYGLGPGMVLHTDGGVLVNTARPGIWVEHQAGRTMRRGTPLYPADPPPVTTQTGPGQYQITPAQYVSAGLALLADTLVLQGIMSLPRRFDWSDPPQRDEYRYSIGLFTRDGQHVTSIQLPPGALIPYLATDGRDRIYLPFSDPFPQLHEFRLVPCTHE